MGIRIEDSVCVGDDEPLILSTEAVKEVCRPTAAGKRWHTDSDRSMTSKLSGHNAFFCTIAYVRIIQNICSNEGRCKHCKLFVLSLIRCAATAC